jgi:two-component system chemotaxis response regulator CheB
LPENQPAHDLIVVGASAGGVEALRVLAEGLPADFGAAVCVVLHLPTDGVSTLPRILQRAGLLDASHVEDEMPLVSGRIYVARPDRHLIIQPGKVVSIVGPRENRHRPAIDPLFRTAAAVYGPRVIAVVLTGSGDDGTVGAGAVKRRGGLVVVQDPHDAFCGLMPARAMEAVAPDHVLPLTEIAPLLARLTPRNSPPEPVTPPAPAERRSEMTAHEDTRQTGSEQVDAMDAAPDAAPLSGFTCPECGGRIWEMDDEGVLRFRCRVGHAYSAETFIGAHGEALEGALWAALNALEENAALPAAWPSARPTIS